MIWLYAALLVVFGNLVSSLLGASALLPGGSWPFVISGAALIVVSVAAARALRLDAAALGLGQVGVLLRGAAIGGIAAGAVALAGVAVVRLVIPVIVGVQVEYAPLSQVTAGALATHIAAFLLFGAVLPEEIAFRGVLLGALLRDRGAPAAIALSAAVFALWHGSVAVVTVGDTTLGPPSPWFFPAVLGALVVVFGGGVVFALIRIRTGTLASTIAAHWAFNAVILLGLWTTKPLSRLAQ